jgi:hypothetical protein
MAKLIDPTLRSQLIIGIRQKAREARQLLRYRAGGLIVFFMARWLGAAGAHSGEVQVTMTCYPLDSSPYEVTANAKTNQLVIVSKKGNRRSYMIVNI